MTVADAVARLERAMRDPEMAAEMEAQSPGVVSDRPDPPEIDNLKRKYRGRRKSKVKVPDDFPEDLLPNVPGYHPPTDDAHHRLVRRREEKRTLPSFTEIK